jgi:hypothetical protein
MTLNHLVGTYPFQKTQEMTKMNNSAKSTWTLLNREAKARTTVPWDIAATKAALTRRGDLWSSIEILLLRMLMLVAPSCWFKLTPVIDNTVTSIENLGDAMFLGARIHPRNASLPVETDLKDIN